MTTVFLRRRKLGRGSTRGISTAMQTVATTVRNFRERDIRAILQAPKLLVRWGCTSEWEGPTRFEDGDYGSYITTTLNSSDSIHWCSNKRNGRMEMQDAGVPVPETWYDVDDFLDDAVLEKRYIIRPDKHAQGRNLLAFSMEQNDDWVEIPDEVSTFIRRHPNYYISEFIPKVAEYRVFVCSNRVVWVAQKTPSNPNDVAWNVARGGRFDNVRWDDWNTKVLDAALKAAKCSGTDFCGVDVMVTREGNPYVLEVNAAPSQTSPYRQKCVAMVFDYIVANSKEIFPDVEWNPRRSYKSYIHPAVRNRDGMVSGSNSTQ